MVLGGILKDKRIKITLHYSTIFRKQSWLHHNSDSSRLQKGCISTIPLARPLFTCVVGFALLEKNCLLNGSHFFTYEWGQVLPRKHKHEILLGANLNFYVFDGNLFFLISLISLFPYSETSDCFIARVLLYLQICGLQCKVTSSKLRVTWISFSNPRKR